MRLSITYQSADSTLIYLHAIPPTAKDHWRIGAIEFMMNDILGILNPLAFPLLYFEVIKFVAKGGELETLLVVMRVNRMS